MASLAETMIVMVVMLAMFKVVISVPNTNITTVLCNSGEFTTGDPFTISLAYVLDDLEAFTPSWKDYDYYNISPYPNAFAYGHGKCNSTLVKSDCANCLGAAKQALHASCPGRIGSRSVLYDCSIRYEQHPFTE